MKCELKFDTSAHPTRYIVGLKPHQLPTNPDQVFSIPRPLFRAYMKAVGHVMAYEDLFAKLVNERTLRHRAGHP